jgi:hypothetical protein
MRIEKDKSQVIQFNEQGSDGPKSFSIAEDAQFLVDALINLYEKPIPSIVREICSNAYDATVENVELDKSKTDKFVVYLDAKKFIVQDFGMGMSPEFIKNSYSQIGYSTKRNSDTQIGAFGVGKLSVFTYSDTIMLTTVHNRVRYEYVLFKDTTINVDLLSSTPLPEDSDEVGTRIEISLKKDDYSQFDDAVKKQLRYFKDFKYVIDEEEYDMRFLCVDFEVPEELKETELFKGVDLEENPVRIYNSDSNWFNSVCFGRVKYPYRLNDAQEKEIDEIFDNLNVETPHWLMDFIPYIPLSAGLKPTPSREALITSEANSEKIVGYYKRFAAVIAYHLRNVDLNKRYELLHPIDVCLLGRYQSVVCNIFLLEGTKLTAYSTKYSTSEHIFDQALIEEIRDNLDEEMLGGVEKYRNSEYKLHPSFSITKETKNDLTKKYFERLGSGSWDSIKYFVHNERHSIRFSMDSNYVDSNMYSNLGYSFGGNPKDTLIATFFDKYYVRSSKSSFDLGVGGIDPYLAENREQIYKELKVIAKSSVFVAFMRKEYGTESLNFYYRRNIGKKALVIPKLEEAYKYLDKIFVSKSELFNQYNDYKEERRKDKAHKLKLIKTELKEKGGSTELVRGDLDAQVEAAKKKFISDATVKYVEFVPRYTYSSSYVSLVDVSTAGIKSFFNPSVQFIVYFSMKDFGVQTRDKNVNAMLTYLQYVYGKEKMKIIMTSKENIELLKLAGLKNDIQSKLFNIEDVKNGLINGLNEVYEAELPKINSLLANITKPNFKMSPTQSMNKIKFDILKRNQEIKDKKIKQFRKKVLINWLDIEIHNSQLEAITKIVPEFTKLYLEFKATYVFGKIDKYEKQNYVLFANDFINVAFKGFASLNGLYSIDVPRKEAFEKIFEEAGLCMQSDSILYELFKYASLIEFLRNVTSEPSAYPALIQALEKERRYYILENAKYRAELDGKRLGFFNDIDLNDTLKTRNSLKTIPETIINRLVDDPYLTSDSISQENETSTNEDEEIHSELSTEA